MQSPLKMHGKHNNNMQYRGRLWHVEKKKKQTLCVEIFYIWRGSSGRKLKTTKSQCEQCISAFEMTCGSEHRVQGEWVSVHFILVSCCSHSCAHIIDSGCLVEGSARRAYLGWVLTRLSDYLCYHSVYWNRFDIVEYFQFNILLCVVDSWPCPCLREKNIVKFLLCVIVLEIEIW